MNFPFEDLIKWHMEWRRGDEEKRRVERREEEREEESREKRR